MGLLSPDEAYAMPPGIFKKITSKAAKGALSSASRVLQGRKLEGKVIQEVRKGRGMWRSIIFDDGTEMTVEKRYINDLCRAKGTKSYIEKFQKQKGEAKTLQAIKSLRYHEARAQDVPRTLTRQMHKMYKTRAAEISQSLPPNTCFVQYNGKFFSMPTEYAEHLEEMGILKISRTKRDVQAVKPKSSLKPQVVTHGTDLDKVESILRGGLRPGSALDHTASGEWSKEFPVQLHFKSPKKGKYVQHNKYYLSSGKEFPDKVVIDLSQYTDAGAEEAMATVSRLREKYPNVRFVLKGKPPENPSALTQANLTRLFMERYDLPKEEAVSMAKQELEDLKYGAHRNLMGYNKPVTDIPSMEKYYDWLESYKK